MNIYDLSRNFWDWTFENPDLVSPNHCALFFFAIEHCNRLGWKEKFGFPTSLAMEAIGIKSYKTYVKTLTDLVDFGFISMVEKSKNQYSSNIIALVKNTKAPTKAPTKALDKAIPKHLPKQVQSTYQSNDSIDIQLYNNTNLPINNIEGEREGDHKFEIEEEKNPDNECAEERKKVAPKKEKEIVDYFNEKCSGLPAVKMLTDSRKAKIRSRIADTDFETVKKVIDLVAASEFLNGGSDRNWSASFDWILEPKNFTKILEGNYQNKPNGKPNNNHTNTAAGNQGRFGGKTSAITLLTRQYASQAKQDLQGEGITIDAEIIR